MNPECGKPWTRKFLSETMTHTFLSGPYKEHRERVLFETEQALMPATQVVIEQMKEQERLIQEVNELQRTIHQLMTHRNLLQRQIAMGTLHREDDDTNRRQFVRRCGDPDCRGFLSTAWKCGLCQKRTCRHCHVVKALQGGLSDDEEQNEEQDEEQNEEQDEEQEDIRGEGHPVEEGGHVCKQEDVETARLLKADTKMCPKCTVAIFKIDGCDQMWCTQCHTAFSWRSGQIQTNVHNPHYYEWLRRQEGGIARNPLDIQCGRELNGRMIPHTLQREIYVRMLRLVGATIHVRDVEIPRYRVDAVVSCQDLRIQYLRRHLTDQEFRVQVQRRHKRNEKKREICDILAMYVQSTTDIVYRALNHYQDEEHKMMAILDEVDALIEYSNTCFLDVAQTFKSKSLVFVQPIPAHFYRFLVTRNI